MHARHGAAGDKQDAQNLKSKRKYAQKGAAQMGLGWSHVCALCEVRRVLMWIWDGARCVRACACVCVCEVRCAHVGLGWSQVRACVRACVKSGVCVCVCVLCKYKENVPCVVALRIVVKPSMAQHSTAQHSVAQHSSGLLPGVCWPAPPRPARSLPFPPSQPSAATTQQQQQS